MTMNGSKVTLVLPSRIAGEVEAYNPLTDCYKVRWPDGSVGIYAANYLIRTNPGLTDAEQAVIDAALAQTGPRSPRLAMALSCLRKERALPAPAPLYDGTDDPGDPYHKI
jgi:hypothetical protein